MITLGLETTTKTGSVALVKSGQILAEQTLAGEMNHSEKLLPAVEKILAGRKLKYKDLDRVAASTGPGSFTGLRIGLTVARAIAQMLDIEVVGVPTLDSLAFGQAPIAPVLCPLIPGLREQVYYSFYRYRPAGQWQSVSKINLGALDQVIDSARAKHQVVVFTGEGLEIHQTALQESLGALAIFAPRRQWPPSAGQIALLGETRKPQAWARIVPLYVRPSEAELHWKGR